MGTNNLSLTGADASFFEINDNKLYLKAGVSLDFETKTSYNVTVNVDDTSIGATPDLTAAYTLTITDVMEGTNGNDILNGTKGNDLIEGFTGNDNLNGANGNDTLIGDDGNDILNGGTGNDSLIGGTDNDIYYVDSANDQIIELLGEGTDTVYSTIDYSLIANVENLILQGTAINGTGNESNNTINGNGSDNVLIGGDGNDNLNGGTGND
ncbi:calcium-binding protein, partial [Geminocystis sp. GBBB08]|uniref:calcium-binding protein n=1 Tax=Geminocystis sp. GBBB08 TaxID=2604140 RepID=UPI0027E31862